MNKPMSKDLCLYFMESIRKAAETKSVFKVVVEHHVLKSFSKGLKEYYHSKTDFHAKIGVQNFVDAYDLICYHETGLPASKFEDADFALVTTNHEIKYFKVFDRCSDNIDRESLIQSINANQQ